MTVISAADLAKELPTILRALAAGEEFVLTDAGRVVGRIIPPSPSISAQPLTADQWQNGFNAWMNEVEARADQYPPGFVLDDSHEAIYGERENGQL